MIRPPRPPSAGEVGDHYDELDRFYRELWGEHLHHGLWRREDDDVSSAVRRLVDRVSDGAAVRPGTRVCDVGCGYGATARLLARERGARVVGYTLSDAQHRVATGRTAGDRSSEARSAGKPGSLRFVLGDWLRDPGEPATYDSVIAVESTAHMEPKAAFYEAASRVLRPGGRLVVCAWTAGEDPSPWQVRHLLAPICVEGRLASLATAGEHRRWSRRAGFDSVDVEDLSRSVRRTWDVVLRRLGGSLARRKTWAYLLDPTSRHRRFGLTVGRIWLAYRLGSLRYTFLTARRLGRADGEGPG